MPDEQPTPPKKKGYQFHWKTFLIDGAIAIVIFLVLQGAFFGVRSVVIRCQDLIERLDGDGHGRGNRSRNRDRDRNQSLEDWIADNLPSEGEREYADVAAVFTRTADALRDGKLRGQEDAFADATRGLMAVATRRVWVSFLTDLTYRAKEERIGSPDDLADVFERIGDAIADCAPRRSWRRTRAVETVWPAESIDDVESVPAAAAPVQLAPGEGEPAPESKPETTPEPVKSVKPAKPVVKIGPAPARVQCNGTTCPTEGVSYGY